MAASSPKNLYEAMRKAHEDSRSHFEKHGKHDGLKLDSDIDAAYKKFPRHSASSYLKHIMNAEWDNESAMIDFFYSVLFGGERHVKSKPIYLGEDADENDYYAITEIVTFQTGRELSNNEANHGFIHEMIPESKGGRRPPFRFGYLIGELFFNPKYNRSLLRWTGFNVYLDIATNNVYLVFDGKAPNPEATAYKLEHSVDDFDDVYTPVKNPWDRLPVGPKFKSGNFPPVHSYLVDSVDKLYEENLRTLFADDRPNMVFSTPIVTYMARQKDVVNEVKRMKTIRTGQQQSAGNQKKPIGFSQTQKGEASQGIPPNSYAGAATGGLHKENVRPTQHQTAASGITEGARKLHIADRQQYPSQRRSPGDGR